ncbi:MAG: outer membrane protein assembly factor BamD [Chlorobi bacterium]|nr:outer membrane protein assembly factor BamD [Chlorobiota bacterium]
MRHLTLFFMLVAAASGIFGCSGSGNSTQTMTTAERFQEAMRLLEDKDYIKAAEMFDVIVTQDPAADVADDAQFYLAETYYRDEQFKLAAFHYNKLLRSFPSSPFYKRGLFQAAMCYFESSPKFDRDQDDTQTAIRQFKIFSDLYPDDDSLNTVARERVGELRDKMAQKEFSIAEQYRKLDDPRAALIYYQKVIDLYPDSRYHVLALEEKARTLKLLGRDKEAMDAVQKFIDENPTSPLVSRVREVQQEISR